MHDPPACENRSANHQPMSQLWVNSKPIGSRVGYCDEAAAGIASLVDSHGA